MLGGMLYKRYKDFVYYIKKNGGPGRFYVTEWIGSIYSYRKINNDW